MYSKVKNLAEESGLWQFLEHQNSDDKTIAALERFVDLIVEKCVDSIQDINLDFLYTTYDISNGKAVIQRVEHQLRAMLGDDDARSDCQ